MIWPLHFVVDNDFAYSFLMLFYTSSTVKLLFLLIILFLPVWKTGCFFFATLLHYSTTWTFFLHFFAHFLLRSSTSPLRFFLQSKKIGWVQKKQSGLLIFFSSFFFLLCKKISGAQKKWAGFCFVIKKQQKMLVQCKKNGQNPPSGQSSMHRFSFFCYHYTEQKNEVEKDKVLCQDKVQAVLFFALQKNERYGKKVSGIKSLPLADKIKFRNPIYHFLILVKNNKLGFYFFEI